jgi:hypothetical protein
MLRAGEASRLSMRWSERNPRFTGLSRGLGFSLEVGIAAGMRGASGPGTEPGATIGRRSQSSRICERR